MANHDTGGHEMNMQTGSSLFEFNISKNFTKAEIITEEQLAALDSFNEDENEQRFLNSKPTCFLVVGKPGVGKSTIAKKISVEWKAELVSPTELIKQNIKLLTELGIKAQSILLKGEAITDAIVAKMIDEKINSPECQHHGYVLEGFPCDGAINFDIGQQMEMMKNWKLQPDFIINLRISDKDLAMRRIDQKIDPFSGNIYVKEMFVPKIKESKKKSVKNEEAGEEEEEEEEQEEEKTQVEENLDEFFALVAPDVAARLVLRPEDNLVMVNQSIKLFKDTLLRVLEDQMANMDESFLLELDANLSPTILIKQLLMRLQSYTINKAAKPLRIADHVEGSEEEQQPDGGMADGEVEEAFNAALNKRRLSPKFKWRKSKFSFHCPVSLKNGKTAPGRPDYAAAFLDKIYMMADENSLREFLKNPRPYIKLPQPRAPCKLSILGNSYTGKTTVCNLLAKKYNARVIDMDHLIEPEMIRLRDENIEKSRVETTERTVDLIKQKFIKKLEEDKIKKEQEEAAAAAAAAAIKERDDENTEEDAKEEQPAETASEVPAEEIKEAEKKSLPASSSTEEEFVYKTDDGDIIVNNNHPELISALEKAIQEAIKATINIPVADYIKTLQIEMEKIRKERAKFDPTAPEDGGWILDNFPTTPEQFHAMVENNLMPDTFFILQDSTEDSNILIRRWYNHNKEQIDEQIYSRLEQEQVSKTDERKKSDDKKTPATETKPVEARDTLEKIVEEDETKEMNAEKKAKNSIVVAKLDRTLLIGSTITANGLPVKGPETQEFITQVKTTIEQIRSIQNQVLNYTGNEGTTIEINKHSSLRKNDLDEFKSAEELCEEAFSSIEKMFKYRATEFDAVEGEEAVGEEEEEEHQGEEEQENEEEEEEDDDEEEDIFDPILKDKKTQFGETNHYCPVTLHKNGILQPGNPELQAKFREKIYRFSNEESKNAFMENPESFLPVGRKRIDIPPPRILILGPRGSGRTTQSRFLAEKLGLFHIKFREYLQELIIGKTKRIVEPEKDEDKEPEKDEEEKAEEEEEEERNKDASPQLTDTEETIKAYLEKDESLPSNIIDDVLRQLWNEEPFKSRGFILDGFPNNDNEAQYLVEKGFFPDAIIILNVNEEAITKRTFQARFDRWRGKMAERKEKKRLKILKKKEKLEKRMKERRDEEIAKFEERRAERQKISAESGEEAVEEEELNIDAIIQEEFAEELLEPEPEEEVSEEDVKENMLNDIKSTFENQNSQIESVKEQLQEVFIPRFKIDGTRKPEIVRFLIQKSLTRFIDNRQSLLERVYRVKTKIANKLIDFGYNQLSRFGRWCPVKMLDRQPIQPNYDEKKKPYAIIHRSFIYFLSSKEASKKFVDDPIRYLKQQSPLSVVPFKLCIVGPPKCGKSTLANRFVKEFGCVRLSVGEAIRAILNNQPATELAQEIQSFLVKGKAVPDELAIQCIETSILDVKCQLKGYILDGFPITRQQVKLMTDRNLIPVKVIELKCEIKEIMQRCIKDRTQPDRLARNLILNDSPETIGYKIREWKNEIGFIRDWYSNEHKNFVQIEGNSSKWSIWNEAKQVGFESISLIQTYLFRVNNHKAASIANLCVTYKEMEKRLGDFGQYCPVSLALNDELINCSENRTMNFVAEYQSYYYKMYSTKELQMFLETPEKFIPPNAPRKLPPPNELPLKVDGKSVIKLVELNGYCPVTYFDGKLRYEAIEQGFDEFSAEYKNKLYNMINKQALDKFMRKPQLYANLVLPHKLPPVKASINLLNIPMTGYLEQHVSEILKRALNEAGNFKPKFPFLSPTRSALLYVAYYFKAYNPKSTEYRRKKYKQKLIYFEEKCHLINFLYKQTTLKYKEPAKRSIEYNAKYESFFALQENAPTMNWLA